MSGLESRLSKLEAVRRAAHAPVTQLRMWTADEEAGVWRDVHTGEAGGRLRDELGSQPPRGRPGEGITDIYLMCSAAGQP